MNNKLIRLITVSHIGKFTSKLVIKLKKFLTLYHKTINLINVPHFKNKYFTLVYLLIGILSFLFNKKFNIILKSIEGLDLNNTSSFDLNLILVYLLILSLIFAKFNILAKIFLAFKNMFFFLKLLKSSNSLIHTKNLKKIIVLYYILNTLFILVIGCFIANFSNNLYNVSFSVGYFSYSYSNLIALLLFFIFLDHIFTTKIKLIKNLNNVYFALFNLFMLVVPFLALNFYISIPASFPSFQHFGDKVFNILFYTVHCDPRDDMLPSLKDAAIQYQAAKKTWVSHNTPEGQSSLQPSPRMLGEGSESVPKNLEPKRFFYNYIQNGIDYLFSLLPNKSNLDNGLERVAV